ncbi:MAG: SRPBCC family protein [Nitrososphaeraceae archaeon]|jgi:ligand-binding SRPBCC domain-containing protein|nr:SRPBCC family protein [Nitrososphaeraceae archaeon]MDW0332314.1 SRPBCC family protein [Nitrososphaeraceae archaeon]
MTQVSTDMTKVEYQIEISAPNEKVYEYYTNPDNIREAWPQDIVKESENVSGSKGEEGSEMKVKGEYMGKKEEMKLQVVDKEPNRKLVTRQTDGPFKKWESIQEFQGNGNTTHIRHTIEYELPTSGKIANTLSGNQADNKIKQGLEQAAQTVKQKLESGQV